MSKKEINSDEHKILRKIDKKPDTSQRELASELGFSLGKLNYCLKELKKKGLVKIDNFKKNKKKLNYLYVITPKGIAEKTKITLRFMKQKMKEYEELKEESEKEL
jgi:EPS-associated MarR family transcriptional regulator